MNIDLKNTNILVTGASRGIGRSIAEHLGRAGARLALHYARDETAARELAESLGSGSHTFQADLEDPGQCSALFADVVSHFGSLQVLVNNAGIALKSPINLADKSWLQDWQQTLNVNLTAAALLCKDAVQHFMTSPGGGRIINIASRAAFRGDTVDYLAYAASKGGMVSLTRSIARGFGKQGIKAFVVAPGFVRTDMAQDFFDTYGEEIALDGLALDRLTEPRDVAPMVTFLASGLADHATGGTFDINAASYVH